VRSSCPSRRSPSGSSGPSGRTPSRASPSRCPRLTSSPNAYRRSSRSSTSASTRVTRPPPVTTGCGPRCARRPFRLSRILAELAPREPEVHGLVALMEIQASRSRARTGPAGEPVLLLDQDRGRWDHVLIRRGLAALERAEELGGALGPYALQAAIAACHARARGGAHAQRTGARAPARARPGVRLTLTPSPRGARVPPGASSSSRAPTRRPLGATPKT